MPDDLKDSILSIFEASLEAQLRAVRRLRGGSPAAAPTAHRTGLSQVDMAFDILKKARAPLHVSEILERIHAAFHVTVERESPSDERAVSVTACPSQRAGWGWSFYI